MTSALEAANHRSKAEHSIMKSSLVALPAETQGSIISHVNYRSAEFQIDGRLPFQIPQQVDLSHLLRSCKALKAVVISKLYSQIRLKVPWKWSTYTSLEHLLASSGEGFHFTRSIEISARQCLSQDEIHNEMAQSTERGGQDAGKAAGPQPIWAESNALNTLIRLLLVRRPSNRLESFRCVHCLHHRCLINASSDC